MLQKEWAWPSSNAPVGLSAASKHASLHPQHVFNMTVKNSVLTSNIVPHQPELVEDRPLSSPEVPANKNGSWKVPSDQQHEKNLQSVDARKGRSVQSFAGMFPVVWVICARASPLVCNNSIGCHLIARF